jgi:quercetin dioxygenase-like cupin family protein
MTQRKFSIAVSLVIVVAAAAWGGQTLNAQQPGFKRVELQRHDVGNPGHEAVMMRGEFNVGAAVPMHTHPGEEVAYILEGEIALAVEGKPTVTLKPGDVFFIPAGTHHSAKNAGTGPAKILSTYIVEKGKPIATVIK